MIKMLTAYTSELDDADIAVREILKQLDIHNYLLQNSVGLVFCYLDFITSGVTEAVCRALPFDTLGCTSQGIVAPGIMGDLILTLTVLTSDDVEFKAGLSEPLGEEQENRLASLYRELSSPPAGPPALMLGFTPSMHNLAGDTVVTVLDRESGGTPLFGFGALDADTKIRTPKTIYRGTAYADRMPLLLLSGNLKPRFFVDSVWNQNNPSQKAVVTAAEGNRMITVNNVPAADYMRKINLITEKKLDMLFMFPLAIEARNGRKNLFIIYAVNEDGSLLCSANTPTGSVIHIAFPGSAEVLSTAKHITDAARETDGQALLIFSCFSRAVIQTDPHDEMEMIRAEMKEAALPYLFMYAGGEICPVYDDKGAPANTYHNHAIISCAL